jgi:hypothetical protein
MTLREFSRFCVLIVVGIPLAWATIYGLSALGARQDWAYAGGFVVWAIAWAIIPQLMMKKGV